MPNIANSISHDCVTYYIAIFSDMERCYLPLKSFENAVLNYIKSESNCDDIQRMAGVLNEMEVIETKSPCIVRKNKVNSRHRDECSENICKVCGKAFSRTHDMKVHLRIHTGIKEFECDICGKPFINKSNMRMQIHAVLKEFECDVCAKTFSRKFQLRNHCSTHMGIKDFKCDVCGEAFATKS